MGVLVLNIVILANLNSYFILRRNKAVVPHFAFQASVLLTLLWGIKNIGPTVPYWSFPIAFITYFLTNLRRARMMTLINISFLLPCAFAFLSPDFAIRFSVTYVMTCFFADQFRQSINISRLQLRHLTIRQQISDNFMLLSQLRKLFFKLITCFKLIVHNGSPYKKAPHRGAF